MKYKQLHIPALVMVVCVIMAIVDAVIQPQYAIKSIIKMILFLIIPCTYALWQKHCNLKSLFILQKGGLPIALLVGLAIYAMIVGTYLVMRQWFDFSSVVISLNQTVGINKTNFIMVALYISFINSLLEEFFFRGFAFFTLKQETSRLFAYLFSSTAFALYHVAMMIGWFAIELTILVIIGLWLGGMIFNFCNEKSGNIYLSWLIHMFANFAINTVGLMLFTTI